MEYTVEFDPGGDTETKSRTGADWVRVKLGEEQKGETVVAKKSEFEIDGRGLKLKDVKALREFPRLVRLFLGKNELHNLKPLHRMASCLRVLDLSDNKITSERDIKSLTVWRT